MFGNFKEILSFLIIKSIKNSLGTKMLNNKDKELFPKKSKKDA